MRDFLLRLAVSAAVLSAASVVTAAGQQLALPKSLASAPAYEVSDRLLNRRTDLGLTDAQAAQLAALSADLHTREDSWQKVRALSSKPWIVPSGRPAPEDAFKRALRTLTPEQRERAVRVLAASGESSD